MIVLDASLAVEMFLGGEQAGLIRQRIEEAGRDMAAPELLDLEFLQVLRRYVYQGDLSPERAQAALETLSFAPIERFSHVPFRERIWTLRDNLTAYDAAYVALAEALNVPLWTRDSKLARIEGLSAQIDIF